MSSNKHITSAVHPILAMMDSPEAHASMTQQKEMAMQNEAIRASVGILTHHPKQGALTPCADRTALAALPPLFPHDITRGPEVKSLVSMIAELLREVL